MWRTQISYVPFKTSLGYRLNKVWRWLICCIYLRWHVVSVVIRLWWMRWWGPSHPSWTCCWCVWSSGSSSVLWGWTCLLENTTTALTKRQRNISRLMKSTTRRNVLHSSTQITVRFAGKTSRSTLITWELDIWHFYKWCVLFYYFVKMSLRVFTLGLKHCYYLWYEVTNFLM